MKLTTNNNNNNNKQATTISYKDDFPTLLNTSKSKNKKQEQKDNNKNKNKKEIFSFASALNNEEKNVAAIKEEAIKEGAQALAAAQEAKPGWVYIKRIDGKINYKYGEMTDAYVNMLIEKQKYERRLDRIYFKRRLDHLQRERDIMNDLLGDLSPYWGTRPLNERFNKNKRGEDESEQEEWEEEEDDEDNKFENKKEEVWTYVL
jgi:hypothetical protein